MERIGMAYAGEFLGTGLIAGSQGVHDGAPFSLYVALRDSWQLVRPWYVSPGSRLLRYAPTGVPVAHHSTSTSDGTDDGTACARGARYVTSYLDDRLQRSTNSVCEQLVLEEMQVWSSRHALSLLYVNSAGGHAG
jgi:hypothetical protein